MSDYAFELFPEVARDERNPTTGVLPCQMLRQLIRSGAILSDLPITDEQIQPASLDLRLGPVAYRLQASFLPGSRATVQKKLCTLTMAQLDLSAGAVLERGCIYLVPLLERLQLPSGLSGKANPKSTTGRLDLFTRIITDYGEEFDHISEAYIGPLYAEIVPRTFSVLVRMGMCLTQIRFVRGHPPPSDADLEEIHRHEGLIYHDDDQATPRIQKGLRLSISLRGDEGTTVAYRARHNAPLIDLGKVNHYEPSEFWESIASPPDGRLILSAGDFYILASKEKVRVPPWFAAEMMPFDPSMGEFRIHYAGFFDPGFGYGSSDIKGTRAVLEVRAHEVAFQIEDAQIVARLNYTRLLERPDRVYGRQIGSSYQYQQLTLSRQFRR